MSSNDDKQTIAPNKPMNETRRVPTRLIVAMVAGNALEFYDFVTYSFFAVYIGRAFFSATDPYSSLLLSVAVFGVGFVFRPLGGLLIGAYADRKGRKPAMLLTIILITTGTLGLALTPSYESIGIAAPVTIVLARLLQGLALGGEVGAATAFMAEIAPEKQRGLYASWQLASQGLAAVAAGVIGVFLSITLSPAEMQSFGWRIPFLFCVVLVPVALFLRASMPETLIQSDPVKTVLATGDAIFGISEPKKRLSDYSGLLFLSILVIMGGTVSNYVVNYMTTYAMTTLHMTASVALAATVIGGLAVLIFSVFGGWLSDHYGRRMIMLLPRLALIVLAVPAFKLLNTSPSPVILYSVTVLIAGLTAISGAASTIAIVELLPRSLRATGVSIVYAAGVAVFGGTTQLLIAWLIGATGDPSAPAWYVVGTSILCAFAMWALPETGRSKLQD